ncbi:Serine/threonine-protein kinase Chk1 [Dermatophagoides farinae]|uniref:Serine/threonine-protein kinase Chk1 n=1 Tax=Dermatophagoides farinae TaxID=6954 RepID=A0A922L378_DERFA|nr:Serine/threonine-protein kinase Chk1 [Dermatophagoides farinae]
MSSLDLSNTVKIVKAIGQGTYGRVYLIQEQRYPNQLLALKVIHILGESLKLKVQKEIQIHCQLEHPNIVKLVHSEQILTNACLYLEYAVNGSLNHHLKTNQLGLVKSKALKYFQHLLNALNYLHGLGFVHRDIRPSNLVIDQNDCLKLTDFGMATMYKYHNEKFMLQISCGIESYRAPETFHFVDRIYVRPHNGVPLDVWSSGIVLVEMLTGRLPWKSVLSKKFKAYKQFVEGDSLDLNEFPALASLDSTIFVMLVEPMLQPNPDCRINLSYIMNDLNIIIGSLPIDEIDQH